MENGKQIEHTGLLKRCPACRSAIAGLVSHKGSYYVNCPDCGMNGSLEAHREDAVEVWNAIDRKPEAWDGLYLDSPRKCLFLHNWTSWALWPTPARSHNSQDRDTLMMRMCKTCGKQDFHRVD